MDGRPAYDLRREVAKRIIPLTQYNMTFVSTNDEEVNLYFPERCPMPACFDLPRCAACAPRKPADARARRLARAGAGGVPVPVLMRAPAPAGAGAGAGPCAGGGQGAPGCTTGMLKQGVSGLRVHSHCKTAA